MGCLLLIPFLLIRFGLLALLNREALKRAAHFPPLVKAEKVAYWTYQISALALYVYPFFPKVKTVPSALFCTGIMLYIAGTVLTIISLINFAAPCESGVNKNGLYRVSRNPMYVAYFVFFIGCVLLTQSWILFGFVLVFQLSTHWIILAEERWCIETLGEDYIRYMNSVRRYI